MGKTSVVSRLNLPGRIGWITMESPGFLTLLYVMNSLTKATGTTALALPWQNKLLAGLFVRGSPLNFFPSPLFLDIFWIARAMNLPRAKDRRQRRRCSELLD